MREIISLQIGQGGNQIGFSFWETVLREHSINLNGEYTEKSDYQREKIDTYFNETEDGRYQPRSLQIDLDPGLIDSVRLKPLGKLFDIDSFIISQSGAGNNFGKAKYEMEFDNSPNDQVRIFAEKCDSLQGFQIFRSLGGGTGSGQGDQLTCQLREEYPDKIISSFCIFPSPLVCDVVVEPYNVVLSMPGLIEHSNQCFIYDNSSLYYLCTRNLKISQPTYKNLNNIIDYCTSGVTSCWRFPSTIYNDMRKMCMNLNLYPRLHFLNTSIAPIAQQDISVSNLQVSQMISMLKNNRNFLCQSNNFDKQLELSSVSVFRGDNFFEQEVEEQLINAYKYDKRFSPTFIPENQKYIINNQKFNNTNQDSALKITNSTSILDVLQNSEVRFHQLFKRKAFLFGMSSGMDEMEYTEAQSYLKDVIQEYTSLEKDHEYIDLQNQNEDNQQGKEKEKKSFQDKTNSFISLSF